MPTSNGQRQKLISIEGHGLMLRQEVDGVEASRDEQICEGRCLGERSRGEKISEAAESKNLKSAIVAK